MSQFIPLTEAAERYNQSVSTLRRRIGNVGAEHQKKHIRVGAKNRLELDTDFFDKYFQYTPIGASTFIETNNSSSEVEFLRDQVNLLHTHLTNLEERIRELTHLMALDKKLLGERLPAMETNRSSSLSNMAIFVVVLGIIIAIVLFAIYD